MPTLPSLPGASASEKFMGGSRRAEGGVTQEPWGTRLGCSDVIVVFLLIISGVCLEVRRSCGGQENQ